MRNNCGRVHERRSERFESRVIFSRTCYHSVRSHPREIQLAYVHATILSLRSKSSRLPACDQSTPLTDECCFQSLAKGPRYYYHKGFCISISARIITYTFSGLKSSPYNHMKKHERFKDSKPRSESIILIQKLNHQTEPNPIAVRDFKHSRWAISCLLRLATASVARGMGT